MTPATLRRMEWAGNIDGWVCCPCCEVHEGHPDGHAPDCELDAAIREAERRETGERPAIQEGDIITAYPKPAERIQVGRIGAQAWNGIVLGDPARVLRLERVGKVLYDNTRNPLWRQEAPTHD